MNLLKSVLLALFVCLAEASSFLEMSVTKKRFDDINGPMENVQPRVILERNRHLHKRVDLIENSISFNQIFYTTDLEIGSDKQVVSVLLDSGSADLVVNSYENPLCESDDESDDESESEGDDDDTQYSNSSSSALYKRENSGFNICYENDSKVTYPHLKNSPEQQAPSNNFLNQISGTLDELYSCSHYGMFNLSSSSTFSASSELLNITYSDGTDFVGNYVSDDVTIGGATVTNLTFGLSTNGTRPSNILGLGFKSNENVYQEGGKQYDNLLAKLKASGVIKKQVYSIFASHKFPSSNNIIFGGYDKNGYDLKTGLTLLPIIDYTVNSKTGNGPYYLSITLNSLLFKYSSSNSSELIASGNAPVIIDTGASVSILPYYIYDEIIVKYGFEWSSQITQYVISETDIPKEDAYITFNFQNLLIKVPVIDFTYPVLDGNTLTYTGMRMFSPYSGDGNYFLLGDDFLGNVYLVADLDDKTVALGQSNPDYTSEKDVEEVESNIKHAVQSSDWDNVYGSNGKTSLILTSVYDPTAVANVPGSTNETTWQFYIPGIGANLGW